MVSSLYYPNNPTGAGRLNYKNLIVTFLKEHNNYDKEFLAEMFSISPNLDISVEDIALAYSSPDPDK